MTPPTKCEAVRRASIICVDLAELDELGSETTILFKRFDETRWHWCVVVEHDILPLVSPGHVHLAYQSVKTFNRMIEQSIAKAIAGVPAEEDQAAQNLLQQRAWQQAQQLANQYYQAGTAAGPVWTGGLLGQTISSGNTGLSRLSQATATTPWSSTP